MHIIHNVSLFDETVSSYIILPAIIPFHDEAIIRPGLLQYNIVRTS